MSMAELSDAYAIGLLADLEPLVERLDRELQDSRARAARIDTELSDLLVRLDDCTRELARVQRQSEDAAAALAIHNSRTASLHQEIAAVTRRAGEIKLEMERFDPDEPAYARLRRERARQLVQLEDYESDLAKIKTAVDAARGSLSSAESQTVQQKEESRRLVAELDRLQSQLPSPQLYLRLFEARAGRAHCRLLLDRDPTAWEQEMRAAITHVAELHRELRAGKYRLDKNSDVVGGRAMASAEAVYGAAALGDRALAAELFASITDASLFLDQIFNVFRVWCLGLYLAGARQELDRLLERHRYATGLRGGYAEAFLGLLGRDGRRLNAALKTISRSEWDSWQDPMSTRGAGVVSLGATALARLAIDAGVRVSLPGPTVPDDVIAGPGRAVGQRG
jgi:hypothetical protein